MSLTPVNATPGVVAIASSELDTLRRTIGHDLDDNEFELFAAICRRTGLDPFARQIYAVKRYDGRQKREVMQIQTGIDGLRLIAERSQVYAGQTPAEWCGPDGVWRDVWLAPEAPAAARVGVLRHDFKEPVYGVAKFSSYCATTREGKPMALWASMPEVMIAKCAEALAIRKAFPNDVSGVYTREEMAQQDNGAGPVLATPAHMERINELLPAVPDEAMPELRQWKIDNGVTMKAGEFTAEMADDVIAKLTELAEFEQEETDPTCAPSAHVSLLADPNTPTASATGAGGENDQGAGQPADLAGKDPDSHVEAEDPLPAPEDAWSTVDKAAFDRWQRGARATANGALSANKDEYQAQWEALVYAASGGTQTSSKALTKDQCGWLKTRLMDLSSGKGRLVETDDAQYLGWKVDV